MSSSPPIENEGGFPVATDKREVRNEWTLTHRTRSLVHADKPRRVLVSSLWRNGTPGTSSREEISAVRAGKRQPLAAAAGTGKEIRDRESPRYWKQRFDWFGSRGAF